MKAKNAGAIIILLSLFAASCKQEPIFYIIASETAPRPPRIEGAPTNMVVFHRDYPDPTDEEPGKTKPVPILYVASGKLHWYAKAPGTDESRWDLEDYKIDQPEGKIIALATTNEYLYVLCLTGHNVSSTLMRIGRSSETSTWETIDSPTGTLIQSIQADPERPYLFAGAGKNDRSRAIYAILYLDNNTDTLEILKDDTSIFSGIAYREDIYYLSTRGDGRKDGIGGIFQISETDLATNNIDETTIQQLSDNSAIIEDKDRNPHRTFMGMIKLEDNTIIAVERNAGYIYKVQDGSFERMSGSSGNGISTGKYATGALALWENYENSDSKMLIAGIQGGLYSTAISSYTHGYVEFELFPDGQFNVNIPRRDPGKLQSVTDNDRYTASLGKHPINHLFQSPRDIDVNMTFFASTQTAGLWSYRDRPNNGGLQWNAEE